MADADSIRIAAMRVTTNTLVEPGTGCHFSPRMRNRNEPRRAYVDGRSWNATRVVWTHVHGPIPEGIVVCHHCDTRACTNIDHLFIGTQAENMEDMTRKGRRVLGDRLGDFQAARDINRKIPRDEIPDIVRSTLTNKQLAAKYGVSWEHISRIRSRRKCWRHHDFRRSLSLTSKS